MTGSDEGGIRTLADVERRVNEVTALRGDDEAAHAAEDRLHQDVLRAIAEGIDGHHRFGRMEMAQLAHAALQTSHIDFARWCA